MSGKITERGQITIPKPLRQKYGLSPNVEIEVLDQDGKLVIVKAPYGLSPVDRVYGAVRIDESSDDYLRAIRAR